MELTALADKVDAHSERGGRRLNKTTRKITLTINPQYVIILGSKIAKMLGISSTDEATGPLPNNLGIKYIH